MAENTDKGPRPRGLGNRARITTFFVRTFFRFLGWIRFFKVTIIGQEKLPAKDAIILSVAPHMSMFDIFPVWTALRRPGIALGAAEQVNRPIIRPLTEALGQIAVKRDDAESRAAARLAVLNALAWLAAFIIFPHGKIVRPGEEHTEFHNGVADFALQSGAVVYPVFLEGANKVMPHKKDRKGWRIINRGHRIYVVIGDPIHPDDFNSREELLLTIKKRTFELEDQIPRK